MTDVTEASGPASGSAASAGAHGLGRWLRFATLLVMLLAILLLQAGAARAAGVSFQRLGIAVGSTPQSVAVGDFNGDGRQDLAVANSGSGTVSILLGSGDGTFTQAPGSPITVGSAPRSVAVGDFNGDGIQDLAVANEDSGTVTILLGNGNGTFSPASGSTITVGNQPFSVAVGDFNGDGKQDLAVANSGSGTVSILLGNGDGTFTQAPGSPITVGSAPRSVAVGDFNGDGWQDLAVANWGSGTVTILLGNGNGTFTPASGSPITVGTQPFSVAVGDFNGDGKQDLAVANSGSGTVSVLLGNGDGTFTPAPGSPITAGSDPYSVAVGDFNGDGIQDLAVANEGSGTVSILLGNGDGSFTQASGSPITAGAIPFSVAVADFNGDGKPDLAVANYGSNSVTALLNTSQPAVTAAPSTVAFPPAQVGSVSSSQPVTVTNTGEAPLYVYYASVAGAGTDADEFKISDDGCSGTTVEAGASCTIGIRFSPVAAGPATAQLRISSNVSGTYSLVALSGAAYPSPTSGLAFSTTPGPAFATGSNSNGQLGNGGLSVSSPVMVKPASLTFVQLAAGYAHTLALRSDGTVWAWGYNLAGQLGDGSTVDSHEPVQVPAPGGMVAVAAGSYHSLALRSDGTVWAWGDNGYGQLGDGTTTSSSTPVEVSGLSNVVAIAAGDYHSLALRSDGTVWAWGYNGDGELGNGCTIGTNCTNSSTPVEVRGVGGTGALSGVTAIAAGGSHSLALNSAGQVFAWGYNADGQLGNGNTTGSSTPVQVLGVGGTATLSGVSAIAAGVAHSLALLSNGAVRAWGYNDNGQLGNGCTIGTNCTYSSTPLEVHGVGGTGTLSGVTAIAAGATHSLALNSTGQVFAWGYNGDGELGNKTTTNSSTPVQMTAINHGGAALGTGPEASHSLIIGQPYAVPSPATLNFGSEPVGTPSTSQVEAVTNEGVVPLQITSDTIIGSDGDEFTITGDSCAGSTLAPNTTCGIGVRFDPKASGTPAARLRIDSNSPTSPNVVILDPPPFKGSATGPMAAAPTLTAAAQPPAIASCTVARETRGKLILHCKLPEPSNHRVKLRLMRGTHTLATATIRPRTRTFDVRLLLPQGLKHGRYTLTIATNDPTARTAQAIDLRAIHPAPPR